MVSRILDLLSKLKDGTFIRFRDRETAAYTLASVIMSSVKNTTDRNSEVLTLGIPRGGIIIAYHVAKKLECNFDFIMPGRLVAPNNPELTIGAIMDDCKTSYLISSIIEELQIDEEYIMEEKKNR